MPDSVIQEQFSRLLEILLKENDLTGEANHSHLKLSIKSRKLWYNFLRKQMTSNMLVGRASCGTGITTTTTTITTKCKWGRGMTYFA